LSVFGWILFEMRRGRLIGCYDERVAYEEVLKCLCES
jgi:hypothetical protein